MRDRIALLPYRGILRFADGTLASRAGSACDRAVLLAELLRATGHDVRFARGRLDASTVERLRRLIDRPPTAASRPLAVDRPDPALEAAVVEAGLPAEAWQRALYETQAETAALLETFARDLADVRVRLAEVFGDALRQAGRPAETPERAVREALAEHCWVQLHTSEGWLDLDPTPGLKPGQAVAAPASVGEGPDPALLPELELRLLVHRRQGERRESATVLAARAHPDSGLWTAQLAVIPEVRGAGLLPALAAGRLHEGFDVHVPVLRTEGARLVGQPFDLTGRPLETDFDARNARRMGETTGGLFGRALGVLNEALGEGAAPREEPFVFDGLELRLRLRLPDGGERTARRLLVPPMPADQLRRSLLLTVDLAPTAARMPRERLLAETIETALAVRPLWTAAVSGADPLRTEMAARRLFAVSSDLPAFLQLRSALHEYLMAELFPDLVAVPDGPHLVARFKRLRPGASGPRVERGFDLVFTDVRVLPREPGAEADPAAAVRLLSIADNVLEHVAAGPHPWSGVALLAAAREAGVPLSVVRRTEDLEGFGHVPDYARGLIADELAAGRVVALPAAPLPEGRFAFWSLDPATGTVRATGADGTGQALAEYSEQISALVAGSVADCALAAALTGGMDTREFTMCIAIGIVVGGAVGVPVSRLMEYAGLSSFTAGVAGDVAGSLASEAYGRLLEADPQALLPPVLARALTTAPASASSIVPPSGDVARSPARTVVLPKVRPPAEVIEPLPSASVGRSPPAPAAPATAGMRERARTAPAGTTAGAGASASGGGAANPRPKPVVRSSSSGTPASAGQPGRPDRQGNAEGQGPPSPSPTPTRTPHPRQPRSRREPSATPPRRRRRKPCRPLRRAA